MESKHTQPEAPKRPSEFVSEPNFDMLFSSFDLPIGRSIVQSADKGLYCKTHKGDLVFFNSNIIIRSVGKIWYGDLNINLDFDNLKEIADVLNEDLYILMEGDARFGYENESIEKLIKKARTIIKSNTKNTVKKEKKSSIFKLTKKQKHGNNNYRTGRSSFTSKS